MSVLMPVLRPHMFDQDNEVIHRPEVSSSSSQG